MQQFIFILLLLLSFSVIAETTDVGHFALDLLEPVDVFASMISTVSILGGILFIFAAIIRFMRHRENPYAFPISSSIVLLILGFIFLCIPFIQKIMEKGIG